MPSLHRILLNIRNELGYRKEDRGICVIYAEKGIDAFLVGEYTSVFEPRCAYINKYYKEWPGLFQRAKTEIKSRSFFLTNKKDESPTLIFKRKKNTDESAPHPAQEKLSDIDLQMIFGVAALIDQGELYFNPLDYSDVYGRMLHHRQTQEISVYAQSAALEAMGGRALLASFFGVYTFEELIQYGVLLNQLAAASTHDFALSLSSENHRIGLCYSHTNKTWLLVDANQPTTDPIIANVDDAAILIQQLLHAFSTKSAQFNALSTQIFTTGVHQPQCQGFIDTIIASDTFIAIHDVTRERATRITAGGITLSLLAAHSACTSTLKKISMLDPIVPMNQLSHTGQSALLIAAQNGDLSLLNILIKTSADLNQHDGNGRNPIFLAARYGHDKALQLLVETYGESASIYLNQADNDGMTPVLVAAKHGHLPVLQFLIDAQSPLDNRALVDLNQTGADGSTPAILAAYRRQTKALQLLVNAKIRLSEKPAVNIDLQNKKNVAPIHAAAHLGHADIVKILIDAGANLTSLYKGASPLELATQQGHTNVVKLLHDALGLLDELNPVTLVLRNSSSGR